MSGEMLAAVAILRSALAGSLEGLDHGRSNRQRH